MFLNICIDYAFMLCVHYLLQINKYFKNEQETLKKVTFSGSKSQIPQQLRACMVFVWNSETLAGIRSLVFKILFRWFLTHIPQYTYIGIICQNGLKSNYIKDSERYGKGMAPCQNKLFSLVMELFCTKHQNI